MRASPEELRTSQAIWRGLDGAEKLEAIAGIAERMRSGEYADPAFVPLLENYLQKKLWKRPLRPKAHPPPSQRGNRKAQAKAEFLARARRDSEVAKGRI
jgi:hypothetical protein